ncbi:hypothetical protein [Bradyrhizobium sp. RT10b]|uniref:hypothetical protein n=1 Tax=Bradyrhizobium sp. RT10b TaxID=3156331 RepID=UPI00339A920F
MIKTLRQPIIRPVPMPTPQCSEVVYSVGHDQQWRIKWYSERRPGNDPTRCQHESNIEIDGKPYCRRHAGSIALSKWIRGELVEKRK